MREAKDLKNAIIFCNRKREVALLYKSLQKHGFSVGALHGDMDQSARTAALDQFRKGEIPLLVASDVAARGLDIPAVSHVFNFDVPHHADDYVHRIGRTGRAGRAGTAISIVTPLDQKSMVAIEKLIGQSHSPRRRRTSTASPADGFGGPVQRRKRAAASLARPRTAQERDQERDANGHVKIRVTVRRRPQAAPRARTAAFGRRPQRQPAAASGSSRVYAAVAPAASRTPSIGRAEAPQAPREPASEPADHSHLPAFLLRPVRARV